MTCDFMRCLKAQPAVSALFYFTNRQASVPHKITVYNVFIFALKMELTPRTGENLLNPLFTLGICTFSIQNPPIIISYRRHIQRGFFTPLNFERSYRHLQHFFLQSHIFHRKIVRFFSAAFEASSARIQALTSIGAATVFHSRKLAQSAVRIAQCAMNKGFGFQVWNSGDFLNFSQSQLTRQNHALKAHFLQKQRAFFIMHRHLRTGMSFNLRIFFLHNPSHA